MSVIIGIMSMVWGSYIVQPEWFDDGPYVETSKFATLGECQIDTDGTKDLCVSNGINFSSYVIDKTAKPKTEGKLNYVECDAWQGCYIKE